MILSHISDSSSLRALVHASPIFHTLYLRNRERILTEATLRDLEKRNIDVLRPNDFAEVHYDLSEHMRNMMYYKDRSYLRYVLKQSISDVRGQIAEGRVVSLKVDECIMLSAVDEYFGWHFIEDNSDSPRKVEPDEEISGRTIQHRGKYSVMAF